MYTALPSRRGCSQVLFLEIMSPHFDSITLRLQRWVGATLLDCCQRASCAPTSPTIRWNYESVEYNSHIPCVQTPFLSALDAWDQPAVWGVEHATRPSLRAIHTRRASFVPRRILDIVTTKSGTTFRKVAPKSSGTQSQRLDRRVPTHVTEGSHWFRA